MRRRGVAFTIAAALISTAAAGQRLFLTDSCLTPAICIYAMASRMGHSFRLTERLSVINVTHKTVDESCISRCRVRTGGAERLSSERGR
jgi:hypothetical protein